MVEGDRMTTSSMIFSQRPIVDCTSFFSLGIFQLMVEESCC